MIRAFLVMVLTLAAAATSGTALFMPTGPAPTQTALAPDEPAMPRDRLAMSALPATQQTDDAFDDGLPRGPALVLDGSLSPLPRPVEVMTMRPHPRPPSARQIVAGARIPTPPATLQNASDLTCIAVAIYHEARDQTDFGQRAVASVILQRAAVPHRWGRTACDSVVPTQFSFLTSRYDYPPIDDMASWRKAVRFAAEAFLQGPMRELRGADHYHTTEVSPDWAPKMTRIRVIGDHVFYADPGSNLSL